MAFSHSRLRSRLPRRHGRIAAVLFSAAFVILCVLPSCRSGQTSGTGKDAAGSSAEKSDRSDSPARDSGGGAEHPDGKRETGKKDDPAGKPTKASGDDREKADPAADESKGNDRDKRTTTKPGEESARKDNGNVKDGKQTPAESETKESRAAKENENQVRRPEETEETGADRRRARPSREILPEDRNDGFVSDSSYQVFITVFARDQAEAVRTGRADAARKTLNLILKETAGGRPSESARKEMKRYVDTHGEVVKVVQESRDSWSIVFRVQKEGLREYVKRLK